MTIEQLEEDPQYEEVLRLGHDTMVPFLLEELEKSSLLLKGFRWWNILLGITILTSGMIQLMNGHIRLGTWLWWLFQGLAAGTTIIIPIHELLHGLAYRLRGAKKISYGANLRHLYFYAAADRFVLGYSGFRMVAMAPFVVVSLACILGVFLLPQNGKWLMGGLLLMHSINCLGDFAMLSFFQREGKNELLTYDKVEEGVSYVFRKKNEVISE